mmetsp:Transcript_5700/g.11767  ORF Transcript_5700/g.11767 Transcript_5700/m.11767 type:complete len:144 (+) Transcript_5700:703-1134(+)
MNANLSKELQAQHGVWSMPICKDDEVLITRGMYETRKGKFTAVYGKKWVVHVECISWEKINGASVLVGIPALALVITKLKLHKDQKAKLEAKAGSKGEKKDEVMANIDYVRRYKTEGWQQSMSLPGHTINNKYCCCYCRNQHT